MSEVNAAWIADKLGARWSAEIPARVTARAKILIADFVGAALAGSVEPEQAALRGKLLRRSNAAGTCTVVGHDQKAVASTAAFLNASSGTAGELDDLLPEARTHPGTHVIPVALALAEADSAGGADFVRSVVMGYEASALLGELFHERPDWIHPHGYLTTVAAAVAGAAVRKLDVGSLTDLINCALVFSPRLPFAAAWEGATVRNAYAGFGTMVAMRSLDCIEAGMTAPVEAVPFVRDRVGIARDAAPVPSDPSTYAVERAAVKFLPVCFSLHPVLYSVRKLREQLKGAPIDRVEVTGSSHLGNFMRPKPPNTLARRFNLPFSVAEEIVHGLSPGHPFHADDPAVARLAANVALFESADTTSVCLLGTDGKRFEAAVPPKVPYPAEDELGEQIRAKFLTAVELHSGGRRPDDLWTHLMAIDSVGRVDLRAII
jgi:2-methylcitrate dehydratase PrpD